MDTYHVAKDGYGEEALWRGEPGADDVQCVVYRYLLDKQDPVLWPTLAGYFAWSQRTSRNERAYLVLDDGFKATVHTDSLCRPAVPTVQPDSGTMRDLLARLLRTSSAEDWPEGRDGHGDIQIDVDAATMRIWAYVAPLVERLHQAEAAGTKFDERLSDVQDEHRKALASWDRQRGSLTAERDQLRADLAAERAAHVTTAELMTMHSQAAEALRTRQIQLNRDLTEARRELTLATAEAEDARDGGMELALELAEARAEVDRARSQAEGQHLINRAMALWMDTESEYATLFAQFELVLWLHAEAAWQRDEAREKGHALLDDLVREQTARANAEADVRKAIERAGDSWRATVETEATEA